MVNKNLEKRIVEEILGLKYGGMYGGDAFCDFRENFYNKIEPTEKPLTIDILMTLLRDKSRDPDIVSRVAWICADLDVPSTAEEIKKLNVDRRFQGTIYGNAIKAVLDQLEAENKLVADIRRIKDKHALMAVYNETIAFYRRLRGDTSQMYASRDLYEKTEAGLSVEVIKNILNKIMRSDRHELDLKEKVAQMMSDLNVK